MAIVGMKNSNQVPVERTIPLAEMAYNNLTLCINEASVILQLARSLSAMLLGPRPCDVETDCSKGEGLLPRIVSNAENLRAFLAKINEELRYIESEIFESWNGEEREVAK